MHNIEELVGKELGGCKIEKILGYGGMGVVFYGIQNPLDREVAIKVLLPQYSSKENFKKRFLLEAKSVAKLEHKNIVTLYTAGEENDILYLVMQYIDGISLMEVMENKKRVRCAQALECITQVAQGLAEAHEHGLIHRDIKPANIMVTRKNVLKIMDFGLAKILADDSFDLTQTGTFLGTPQYMSPEQWESKTLDCKTDIYSLGVTFYFLISGVRPFDAKTLPLLMNKHLSYTPPSVHTLSRSIPQEFSIVISKMLEKNRINRYRNCHELIKDLELLKNVLKGKTEKVNIITKRQEVSTKRKTGPITINQNQKTKDGFVKPTTPKKAKTKGSWFFGFLLLLTIAVLIYACVNHWEGVLKLKNWVVQFTYTIIQKFK